MGLFPNDDHQLELRVQHLEDQVAQLWQLVQRQRLEPNGEPDGFVHAILDEIGIDLSKHKPKSIEELEEWEGLNFDLIITLSPEAHHKALDLTRTHAAEVEYWPTVDPTVFQGSREQKLDAYRDVRDGLIKRIKQRLQS